MPQSPKQKFAVIGWPVRHSVSPAMQQAAFDALGITADYSRVPCRPEELDECMRRLTDTGFAGWNITVPHKESACAFMDELSETAKDAGSVNTVVNRNGHLTGHSTDGYGLLRALQENFGFSVHRTHVVFLGCGGAARAAASYLVQLGIGHLTLINRTVSKAQNLAQTLTETGTKCKMDVMAPTDIDAVHEALANRPLIIQATSLGLKKEDPLPLDPQLVPAGTAVFDMIYGDTPFLAAMRDRDCHVADGRGMLLHQGARSFTLWTGREAPVEAMRKALDNAIAARSTH
jgi:shikimate dehydrogenase